MIVEAKTEYESNLISNYASGNNSLIYKYISKSLLTTCDQDKATATCDQDTTTATATYTATYTATATATATYTTTDTATCDQDTATCDQDKARLFNNYFYSVFNDKDLTNDSQTTTNETSGTSLSDIVITAEDVHEALVSLDPYKAMGPALKY